MKLTTEAYANTMQALTAAKNNRPDPNCSKIITCQGIVYAWIDMGDGACIWELRPCDTPAKFAWITNYTKQADMEFIKALRVHGSDYSVPEYEGNHGYNVVMFANGSSGETVTAWYADLHDAMKFASGRGAHPDHGHPTIVGIYHCLEAGK